jgi:hypothetical protein
VQLDKDARDAKAGIKKTVNKLAMKKRAERLAREAKTRKGR